MNSSSSAPNLANNNAKVRFGLIKVFIGSDHVIKGPDGLNRQFKVRDKSKFPKVECQCVCLTCNKAFEDEETLLAEHPENRIMTKQQEKHVYAWWSTKPVIAAVADVKAEKDKKVVVDYTNIIGLMSDEEMPNQ
jgi:hypothetical protein